jgi:hypothetical protein
MYANLTKRRNPTVICVFLAVVDALFMGWTLSSDAAVQAVGVAIGPDHTRQAEAGQVITYEHILTNTGTIAATFLVEVSSTQDWPVELLGGIYPTGTPVLPLYASPQMPIPFQVSLTVPSGVAGVTEITLITATSQVSPTVQDTAMDTTIVLSRIYLPLVFRRWPPIPYKPVLNTINDIDCGTYTVSWTEPPQRLADTYTLQEATDPAFTTDLDEVCTTQEQSCEVHDKSAGTYYYRVRGHNAWGSSEWSDSQAAQLPPPCANPDDFIVQGDEFFLDIRYNAIPCVLDSGRGYGVNLSNYILEMTFQGGDGRQAQLYLKNYEWANVYSKRKRITSGQPLRFDPINDPCDVCDFRDFGNIYAIGAKIWGGTQGVEIVSACLIER